MKAFTSPRRSFLSVLLVMGMTNLFIGFGPIAALANHGGSPAGIVGGFEIDGNYTFDSLSGATMDWVNAEAVTGNPVVAISDPFDSSSDDVFKGGGKEQGPDTWEFQNGPKPPGKADLTRVYYESQITGGIAYLWLGFERLDVSGQGDVHVNFELNRSSATITNSKGESIPSRSAGDLLIVYDYSGGAGPVNVEVRAWSGSALSGSWGAPLSMPAGSVYADINDGSVSRPAFDSVPAATIGDRRFGEVGLNLTAIFNGAVPSCPGFAQFWAKTRSSGESFNSDLKDTITPVSVDLSTCPNVHIAKSASDATINADDSFTFTLTATNDGVAAATGVVVTDNLPDVLTGVSATYNVDPSTAGETACTVGAGNVVTCNVGTLAASDGDSTGSELDTVRVTIHATAPQGACPSISNTTHVSAANEPGTLDDDNDSNTVVVTVNCPAIHITKTAGSTTVDAGDPLSYTINVWNSGPGTANDVQVTDDIPQPGGVTWSLSPAVAGCAISDGHSLECTFATMVSGTSTSNNKSIHIVSTNTTSAVCGVVHNVANVTTTNDGSGQASADITINCPDVKVLKTATPPTVDAGNTATFTIKVWNVGPGVAHDVTLDDVLPSGFAWSEDSPNCDIVDDTLSCSWATLGVGNGSDGNTQTILVTSPTDAEDCGPHENTATVAAENEPQDKVDTDNSSTATLTVNCANIHILKVADALEVNAGDDIGFTITVTNTGLGEATGVHVSDQLPDDPGLDWSIDDGSMAGNCSISISGLLTCDLQALAGLTDDVPGTATVHISSGTTAESCGTVDNTASVSSSNDGSDESSALVQVHCPAINIEKVPSSSLTHVGDTITYTLTVTNTGDVPLLDVVVTDPICDSDPNFVGGDEGSDSILGFVGESLDSEVWTYTCTHVVLESDPDPLPNTVTVVAHDEIGGENGTVTDEDSAIVDVIHPDIQIVKSVTPVSGTPGTTVTYSYEVTNTGDTTLFDVLVTDDLLGDIGVIATLDVDETVTLTKVTVLSAVGSVVNVGTATGSDVLGKKVTDSDTASVAIVLGRVLQRTGLDLKDPAIVGLMLVLFGGALTWLPARKREDDGLAIE